MEDKNGFFEAGNFPTVIASWHTSYQRSLHHGQRVIKGVLVGDVLPADGFIKESFSSQVNELFRC